MMYGSSIFFGLRLFLAGFTPQQYLLDKSRIISEGGVVFDEYSPDCTHVVVQNIALDDPICVTARRDGKTVVTNVWLNDSLEYGELLGIGNILYKPPKALTGIPGANELVICLTGYQGLPREDLKMMVSVMGAQISKPLVVKRVTHLICYKFEGEKYDLAKKMNLTKIVNHQWVVDCLKAWKIIPEEPYSTTSGYECDLMEAEAKDSEDETEDITGRNNSGITNLQNEMGEAHIYSGIGRKLPVSSAQQGFSNSILIKDGKSLQSDLLSESTSVNKLGKQYVQDHRAQSHMDAKSDNVDGQNAALLPSNQIGKGHPSTSGNTKNSGDFEAEKLNSSEYSKKTSKETSVPLHVEEDAEDKIGARKTPSSSRKAPRSRASLQTAGKIAKSDERPEEKITEMTTEGVPTFNLETDEATGFFGVSSSKRQADPKAGSDQGKAASEIGTSSAVAGLFDEKGPGGLLPQKRTADGSNASNTTPKSQKLTTSASKRVGASEPRTAVNKSVERSGALNSGRRIEDEFATSSAGRSSPNVSSAKSNAKNGGPSRSLAFEMLQVSEPMNTDVPTTPKTNSISTSLGVGNKIGQPQTLQKVIDASPGTNDLEAVKSGSPELKSADQTCKSVSNPPKKKMVARKTLGSRPKVSKRSADAQRSSAKKHPVLDDVSIHSAGQEKKEPTAPSPAADKALVPPTVEEPIGLGSSKPQQKSDTEINDYDALLDDETEGPPEFNVDNEFNVAEIVGTKEDLVSQKKEMAVKDRKKSKLAAKEVVKDDADEAEAGKTSDDVNEQVVGAAAKKRRSTLLLNKSKRPVEVEKENESVFIDRAEVGRENELIRNDQFANKGVTGKSALKNKLGSLLSNKSEGPVEVENENEPILHRDGHSDCKNFPSFNMTRDNVEVENRSDCGVSNDQGTNKVAKRPGKLGGKKRRGSLQLKKSVEKENELVLDGGQHNGKLSSASDILDISTEVDKENEPVLANDQNTSKGVKRAGKLAGKKRRGGTLVLNKSEVQVHEGDANKPDLDDGKLTSTKSNLIINESDAVSKGGKHAGKIAGKKRRGTLVLNKSNEVQENDECTRSNPVFDNDEDVTKDGTSKSDLTANESDAAISSSLNIPELEKVKKQQTAYFILCGHRLQRKEFQQLIKRLKGKLCRDSHQWSYQASHFVVPEPIRRTEKFFAAAASGSWILKTDYLTASSQAGKFLPEEPFEWHKNGLSEDGAISFEAPRKWRLLREKTGHGAFYGMRIVIYGECIAPPLETLKRVIKAGDGTILATSPPYTRILESGVDFAIVSPGMPRVDIWVQEFLRHQIPCVLADYLVEYVCKPGYPLDRHVQYNTHEWAAKSFSKLSSLSEEVVGVADAAATATATATPPDDHDQVSDDDDDLACQICGLTDRGEVMLVCGNESGTTGCGVGSHIDCCDPPLKDIPEEDWFCPKCYESLE
ncbi:BRCT domain-containing protein At4g02110 isoform X2 [Spinacia oleracea]|uniref:BRCT domain-containing protein At4g02110 isoform X2 n=1 Tax=Spinacia oleracea TaxID=3562 RepID=A0ABM3QSB5_SPIOL|nr:BRCT domain-containing protein At4g02110 isoform X2 [Spinacia oleracea]